MVTQGLRSIKGLGTAVVVLLAGQIVFHLISIPVLLSRISLVDRYLDGDQITAAEADGADAAVAGVTVIGGVLILATAVVWLVWQHHGQDNLVRRRVEGLRFTPGWAVGWWFVPFANLVKSFQSVRELRLASADPEGWRNAKAPALLGWWWAMWLIGSVSVRTWSTPVTAQDVRGGDVRSILSAVLLIVAALLAIAVVRSITNLQERLRNEPPLAPPLPGGALPPPPS